MSAHMKLVDAYAQTCTEPNAYTPKASKKQARDAVKAKYKELLDAKA